MHNMPRGPAPWRDSSFHDKVDLQDVQRISLAMFVEQVCEVIACPRAVGHSKLEMRSAARCHSAWRIEGQDRARHRASACVVDELQSQERECLRLYGAGRSVLHRIARGHCTGLISEDGAAGNNFEKRGGHVVQRAGSATG